MPDAYGPVVVDVEVLGDLGVVRGANAAVPVRHAGPVCSGDGPTAGARTRPHV